MTYEEAMKFLDSREFGIKADLERMRALCDLLDHPELTYPTIHIAGTNGKSSTARIIGSILAAHGLNTGVYTSPHLQSVRERIALESSAIDSFGSELIAKADFADLIEYLVPFIETVENERSEGVSYFELTTLMAFEWMSRVPVGAGVFEAGLGGTWDATNLVKPGVAVLTHIAVDHERFLGATPAQNASEKVGIIKQGTPVVISEQDADVLDVIERAVAEKGSDLKVLGRDFTLASDAQALGGRLASVHGVFAKYEDLFLPLHGAHQSRNMAVAIAAVETILGRALDDTALRLSLDRVKSLGRLEVVMRAPLVVLDAAHNPDGMKVLLDALDESFGQRRTTFVVSIFADKDATAMLNLLAPFADRLILTRTNSVRAADPKELANLVPASVSQVEVFDELAEAVDAAVGSSLDDELIVVTGSVYGVGEAREHLLGPID